MSRAFLATIALLLATLGVSHLTARRVPESLARPLDTIDSQILGWRVADSQQLDASDLKALAPTEYLSRTYVKGGDFLDLFIAQLILTDSFGAIRHFTFSEALECIELTTESEHLKDRDLGASQRFRRLLWRRSVSLEQLIDP